MEDISTRRYWLITSLAAGALLVDVPHLEELDRVDLFQPGHAYLCRRDRLIRLSNRHLRMG